MLLTCTVNVGPLAANQRNNKEKTKLLSCAERIVTLLVNWQLGHNYTLISGCEYVDCAISTTNIIPWVLIDKHLK